MSLLLLGVVLTSTSAFSSTASRVAVRVQPSDQEKGKVSEITEEEISRFQKRNPGIGREAAIERLVLYRVALVEARRRELDKRPDYRREADRLLYEQFLATELSANREKLEVSDADLKKSYERAPLVRLKHLALAAKTEAEKKKASETLAQIRRALSTGTPFARLVLQYSQDAISSSGGDLDFRGPHQLPEPLYSAALKLSPGAVSAPIELDGAIHLVQLEERRTFAKAGATYLEWLRGKIRSDREEAHLLSTLRGLKSNVEVQTVKRQDIP